MHDKNLTCTSLLKVAQDNYYTGYTAGYREAKHATAERILQSIYDICKERGTVTWDDLFYLTMVHRVEVKK